MLKTCSEFGSDLPESEDENSHANSTGKVSDRQIASPSRLT